jgi:iron complex transport system substrate-binding protein
MQTDQITGTVIDAAIEIHRALGPGLLESAYEELLAGELMARGLSLKRQVKVPFQWKGRPIEFGFRADLLVEDHVVVELKATDQPNPIYGRQVLTYLRLMHLPVGLLINFGSYRLTDGIQRITNNDVPLPGGTRFRRSGEREKRGN